MTSANTQAKQNVKTPVHLHPDDIDTLIGAFAHDIGNSSSRIGDSLIWMRWEKSLPASVKQNKDKIVTSFAFANLLQEMAPSYRQYMTEGSALAKLNSNPYAQSGKVQLVTLLNDIAANGIVADETVIGKKFGFYGKLPNGEDDLVKSLQETARSFITKIGRNIANHNRNQTAYKKDNYGAFAANKDMSGAVQLNGKDIKVLIGAIVSDTVQYDGDSNAFSFRLDAMTHQALTGDALPRNTDGSITNLSSAQILTNICTDHRNIAAQGKALKKLNDYPFNIHGDVHELLDRIAKHGVVKDNTLEDRFTYIRHSASHAGDLFVKTDMLNQGESFVKKIFALAPAFNDTCADHAKYKRPAAPAPAL